MKMKGLCIRLTAGFMTEFPLEPRQDGLEERIYDETNDDLDFLGPWPGHVSRHIRFGGDFLTRDIFQ